MEVELVKERNVCTRKVPFAVTEVVPIVPRENIGSLSLFLSLCGPAIDSIFGRKTLVSVEIEWPINCREKEKKKEEGRKKGKTVRNPTSTILYISNTFHRGFANSRDNVLVVVWLIINDNFRKSFVGFLTIRFELQRRRETRRYRSAYKVSWPLLRNCMYDKLLVWNNFTWQMDSLRRLLERLFPCVDSMARKGKITLTDRARDRDIYFIYAIYLSFPYKSS